MTTIPLALVSRNRKVKIINVVCNLKMKKRLNAIGIFKGANIGVVRNDFSGPLIVKILDSKLGIGRSLAQKIRAEELNNG